MATKPSKVTRYAVFVKVPVLQREFLQAYNITKTQADTYEKTSALPVRIQEVDQNEPISD